jgi:crossover junction endodeoxyribonuclease RuvC
MARKTYYVLAFDISLSCTGVTLFKVCGNKVTAVDADSCKTDEKMPTGERARHIEAWAYLFVFKHRKKGFDYIVRESYAGSFGHHTIFSAWSAVDRALLPFGYEITEKPIGQATVKKTIGGKGNAEKDDVERGVRRYLTNPDFVFANDNESDAAGVGLTFLVKQKLINEIAAP